MESPEVSQLLDQVEEAFEQEDPDRAEELCNEILKLDENNVDARVFLADIALEDGDFETVITLGKEVLALDEHNDEVRLLMAEAYLLDDRPEETLELCDVMLRKNPNNLEARFCLAEALLEMGGAKEAADLYESIVDEQPDNMAAMLGLGVAFYESCQFDLALQALEEVLEQEPDMADAHFHIGLIHERKGNTAAAAKSFKRAASIDSEAYPPPFKVSVKDFERVVEDVLKGFPKRLRDALSNVTISVEEIPSDAELLAGETPLSPNIWGLFRGNTHSELTGGDVLAGLPSEIVLFRANLARSVANRSELLDEIRVTLLHEIAHYLDLDEEQVEALGLK